ncbi:MAG: paraquat-inducible protein B, partial [Alishewanella sp.]|nr:paraquat-inducible protein B [Alishewanella sp.]
PELQQLPSELQQSLNDLRQALAGVSPGSTAYERAGMNLQMMDQVLRELQPVLKMLNQQSNALLINASDNADPQPRKAQQ